MRSVGIKVLNSKLSEYVRLAAGDRIPVLADAFLAEAVRSGVLAPPLTESGSPPKPAPVAILNEVLGELDKSRRDR